MAKQVRQGDVLLVPRAFPRGTKGKKGNAQRRIVAVGEATHHIHVVDVPKAEDMEFYEDPQGRIFLRVKGEGAALKHINDQSQEATGEHGEIAVEPGEYEVIQQREYDGEKERRVWE